MKKIFSVFLLIYALSTLVFAAEERVEIPQRPEGYVSDFVGILSGDTKNQIEKIAYNLDNKTSAQIAVVIVKSTMPNAIETYAVELFKKWGIGQREKNNGILLLIAIDDRKLRIETGYGLEGALPDAICNRIINEIIVPVFKKGDYNSGVLLGSVAIVKYVAAEYNVDISQIISEDVAKDILASSQKAEASDVAVVIFILIVIVTFVCLRLFVPIGGVGRGPHGGGYWGGGIGGGNFGGGFGGGSGGFGGGFSGGGGSSGGW